MLKLKLTAFLFLFCSAAFAQSQNEPPLCLPVQFASPTAKGTFPFSEVNVLDCRFDTSRFGYLKKKKTNFQLVTAGGLANALERALNASLKENSSPAPDLALLVIIKKFWLKTPTQADINRIIRNDDRQGKDPWAWRVKLEVYANRSEIYTPLFRLDSTYTFDEFYEKEPLPLIVLDDLFKRLQGFDTDKIKAGKTRLTKQAIDSFNRAAFLKPVLLDSVKQRGVFLSFSDFVNSRVSHPSFAVELSGEMDNLYVIKNSEKEILTNFWGFCDGKNYYIKSGRNFCGLHRTGNTFEFTGPEPVYRIRTAPGRPLIGNSNSGSDVVSGLTNYGFGILQAKRPKFETWLFQIDMETGETY